MTTQYAEEQGFKKKYLAPLIVLMLCAVSLTGAAYAYSTSVTGHGDVDYDWYSIDMYKDADTVITENLAADKDFDVQTTKVINGGKNAAGETVTGNYYGSVDAVTLTFTTKVKVTTNDKTSTEACNITGTAKYVKQDGTVDFYNAWAGSDAAKAISCKVYIKAESAAESEYALVTDTTVFAGAVNTMYDVKIEVTLPAIDAQDLKVSTPGEIGGAVNFNGKGCIEITLNAKNVSA